ncbi:bestrophin-like domain [Flavobacterium silvaticum]|uniref:DUF4239 domain-containing protein n=1 Tax=Flavobacterium silvaticum TaxID=1852020 RepID=A0A972FYJ7_9FLAO|nr:hypothetical protein [Flavobacterium silvaticum]NMH27201.1 hypothetical protein [Flavobacterium silvaticum]
MNDSLLYQTPTAVISIFLFVLIVVANWLGHYLRRKEIAKNPDSAQEGIGAIEGSLLGLLALLLSFTFGMSASRYDDRRQVIVQEANDIGTALLRCDLYPDSIRKPLRENFSHYINARIAYKNAGIDRKKIDKAQEKTNQYAAQIWKIVSNASQNPANMFRSNQMVPAVNAMIDTVTTRDEIKNKTVPDSIVWLLFVLILTGSFVVGYGNSNKRMNYMVVCGFALMTALTVFLILDLDRPRRGFINIDSAEEKIVELKSLLKE